MTLKELNNNEFGLVFATVKHPIFKSDRVLTMNGVMVGKPAVYDYQLYQQAYDHLNHLEGLATKALKEYKIEA